MPFRLTTLIVLSLILIFPVVASTEQLSESEVSVSSADNINQNINIDSSASVIIFLEDELLQSGINKVSSTNRITRANRIKSITRKLKSFKPDFHQEINQYLNLHSTKSVKEIWVTPAFTAELTQAQIEKVESMYGVSQVVADIQIESIKPVETAPAEAEATSASVSQAQINLSALRAKGLTGEGRLVCSFDTGVEKNHPSLSNQWRGNHTSLSSAWMSTITPESEPTDKSGHGTHTMGIMVGVEGTDTIGVAPGADWITAGVIDQGKSLTSTISDILLAFQWTLDPDGNPATTDDVPDVILNSWGVPAGLFGPCNNTFWSAIDNVEAAGIVTIFAAGNEGPEPSTLRNPANRASSPLSALAIGAVDEANVVATFSARGPTTCNGLSLIKPDIVAPGVSIRSADKNGGYKLMTGTSQAAPFVAGLVALIRQYNPDATVPEIKWALTQSAQDLGATGQDNSYGFGLVDGSTLLDYITDPIIPNFGIAGINVEGGITPVPDNIFDLQIYLTRIIGNTEQVTTILSPSIAGKAIIVANNSNFYFGTDGTIAIGQNSFQIILDKSVRHGENVDFTLEVKDMNGSVLDDLTFTIKAGYTPSGTMSSHMSGDINYTVSDFGQFGFAAGSIYNVGGSGFRYKNSENLLYEAGLILGRNPLQTASAIRSSDGSFRPSDFTPVIPLSNITTNADQAEYMTATMDDSKAEVPIPIVINQETIDYGNTPDGSIIIYKYKLVNNSLERVTNLYFGMMTDFDLNSGSEQVTFDSSIDLISYSAVAQPAVGIVGLDNVTSFQAYNNGLNKRGITNTEQFEMISSPSNLNTDFTGDIFTLVSSGPFILKPGDSVEIAFAIVAADDLFQLYDRAISARELYMTPTSTNDVNSALPSGFELNQNYPNPFNPSTMISFSLPKAEAVTLEIYNTLGQQVKEIKLGSLETGRHTVEWDGKASSGKAVASGVYFYRIKAGEFMKTRKMMLLR